MYSCVRVYALTTGGGETGSQGEGARKADGSSNKIDGCIVNIRDVSQETTRFACLQLLRATRELLMEGETATRSPSVRKQDASDTDTRTREGERERSTKQEPSDNGWSSTSTLCHRRLGVSSHTRYTSVKRRCSNDTSRDRFPLMTLAAAVGINRARAA